jgi:hypothetical protein
MEQLSPGRLYIDEDPDQQLAPLLTTIGHDAVSTSQLGNKGRKDSWQLAFAAHERRTLVTCNIRDFVMLHEAWTSWSQEWRVDTQFPHAGILLIPQRPSIPSSLIVTTIDELLRNEETIANRLFRWRPTTGWQEV